MKRSCDICGDEYEAKRPTSKFCSARCRNRRQRGAAVIGAVPPVLPPEIQSTVSRVSAELLRVGRLDSWRGAAAIKLAAQIDNATAVMGFAALVKQLEATMDAALAGTQQQETDHLDELKARRDRLVG